MLKLQENIPEHKWSDEVLEGLTLVEVSIYKNVALNREILKEVIQQ